ncbi:Retrovirus-related Pol polyprotein from transposon TNT 1-94 [Eumeta japonica]|uniref:Retrovirus-related Pol polyprotein from transposon TNT 1-94 n=1 Tax=Eumeta variegata TaxID=151549 RepID=A0A4C1U9E5_EUMVA|nr:Retrovirus-related Pol polyprotein from transposon TNT 1-94 [Eumeta japonica]
MYDIESASQCIDPNITRDGDKVMLDQEIYINELIARFRMSDRKPVKTLFEVRMKLDEKVEEKKLTDCPYQQAIGLSLYMTQGTRPDIFLAMNTLSRFNKNSKAALWTVVKRVFRYLQGSKDFKLIYTKDGNEKS